MSVVLRRTIVGIGQDDKLSFQLDYLCCQVQGFFTCSNYEHGNEWPHFAQQNQTHVKVHQTILILLSVSTAYIRGQ